MNPFKLIVSWLIVTSFSCSVYAQKANLLYSKTIMSKTGKSVTLELTDSIGSSPVDTHFFNKSNQIFFLIKPIPGQNLVFSKSDADKKVKEIKLIQDKITLKVERSKSKLENEKIIAVIVAYNKNSLYLLQPFTFKLEDAVSEPISIPETLWPNYKEYTDNIKKSQTSYASNDFNGSFNSLTKLWGIDPNFSKFTFYQPSIDTFNKLIEKIISQSQESLLSSVTDFRKNPTEKKLDHLLSLKDSLLANLNSIESFLKVDHEGIDPINFVMSTENTKSSISKDITSANRFFRERMLSIFEERGYQDYKYKFYTELLTKLLITVNKIQPIKGVDNLYISNLKKFPVLKNELLEMGWNEDFAIICRLLNDNIHNKAYFFNDTIISNYQQNKIYEPQPYYTLFKAFNDLIKKEKSQFVAQINQCLITISDKEILSSLDLYISLVNTDTTRNIAYWEILQKGYSAQLNGSYLEAKKYYEKAEKLSISDEVLFFLMGETSLKLGDRFSAEIYFNRALEANPKFILPKLIRIEFLIEDKDYETAIGLVNEALDTNPIWYFYFMKATLLQLTGKYEDAKSIILNDCIALNSLNYDQYLVLGDIHLGLNDIKSARENFMHAGNINPNDKQYKKRMEILNQLPEKHIENNQP